MAKTVKPSAPDWREEAVPVEEPGIVDQAKRQVGLAVRAPIEGAMDFIALGADPLGYTLNRGLEALGSKFRFPENHSAAFSNILTSTGLPKPETTAEKVGNFMGRMVGSSVASLPVETAVRARYALPGTPISERDKLKMAAELAYERSKQSQVVIKGGALQKLGTEMGALLKNEGYASGLHPRVTAAMKELADRAQSGADITLEEAERLRRIFKNAAASQQSDERRIVMSMVDKFDDFVQNLQPADIAGGASKEGVDQLFKARNLWSRLSKGDAIDTLIERAKDRAGQFSGSGFENALRTEFRGFARDPKKMRLFTPAEQNAIRKVSRGGPIENLFRYLGKLAPTGVVSGGVSAGAGYAVGGPAGAVVAPGAGMASRKIAEQMTLRNAETAARLARFGAPPPAQIGGLPLSAIPALGAVAPAVSAAKPDEAQTWRDEAVPLQ